jgi:hypothetical protein
MPTFDIHRRLTALAVATFAIPATIAVSTAPASATAQCVFTPKPPARISIGQSVVGMTTRLAVNDPDCATDFDASTQLVHGTDSYYLMWDTSKPDVESVYADEIVPGTYRTTANDCSAYDADYNELSCSLTNASTVIKFASRTTVTIRRTGATVTFAVRSKRYSDYYGFAGAVAPVAIQRYGNGAWHTIHTATTTRSKGASWSYRRAGSAKYRAITAETNAAFSSTSATIIK